MWCNYYSSHCCDCVGNQEWPSVCHRICNHDRTTDLKILAYSLDPHGTWIGCQYSKLATNLLYWQPIHVINLLYWQSTLSICYIGCQYRQYVILAILATNPRYRFAILAIHVTNLLYWQRGLVANIANITYCLRTDINTNSLYSKYHYLHCSNKKLMSSCSVQMNRILCF